MITLIYIIILTYFVLGATGFYFINRRKDPAVARKSYIKFFSYFVIINALFFSIVIDPIAFKILVILIIAMGFGELIRLFVQSGYQRAGFFVVSIIVYGILALGFYFYGQLNKEVILFSFLVISIFDSFSQITGQLWGKSKLFPTISPNKTFGGLVGGAVVAIISAMLLHSLYSESLLIAAVTGLGLVFFAFWGDIAASFYKRRFEVKDFSNLIPGHGGFLDRFDSLLAAGAWMAFCMVIL